MSFRRRSYLSRVVLAAVWLPLAGLVSCSNDSTDPRMESNSNWLLPCEVSSDCDEDQVCLCEVCMRTCDDASSCSDLPGATCLSGAAAVAAGFCDEPPAEALCLPDAGDEGDPGVPDAADMSPDTAAPACPDGQTYFCSYRLGLPAGDLLRCDAGDYTVAESCDLFCVEQPGGDDFCSPPCGPVGDRVCGGALGLDPDTLYICREDGLTVRAKCINGCSVASDGLDNCAP